jgi:hypothetical protein
VFGYIEDGHVNTIHLTYVYIHTHISIEDTKLQTGGVVRVRLYGI